MHPNRTFRWDDEPAMLALVAARSFTRIFAMTAEGPRVAHVPVLVVEGPALRFHLANANALARHLDGATALAVTEGPNAYLSANWYRDIRGAVPTWNYIAVECEGTVRRLDRAALIDVVDALAHRLEPQVGEDWTRTKMDAPRFDVMLNSITAFELTITALRGTRKVSQNKSDEEVAGVFDGMGRVGAHQMIAAMRAGR